MVATRTPESLKPGDLCTVGNDPKWQPLLYRSLHDIRQRFDDGFLTVTRTVITGTHPVLFLGKCVIPGVESRIGGYSTCYKVLFGERIYYTIGPLIPLVHPDCTK